MSNDSIVYGFSSPLCDYIIRHQIEMIQPRSIVDFGAGAGKVGKIEKEVLDHNYKILSVEGNYKTAQMLVREGPYHEVSNNLIQDWIEANSDHYDLAVFGDVLEHLSTSEINRVMQKSIQMFDHIIIQVPLHEIFQDGGNAIRLETHRSYITANFFDRYLLQEKHIISEMNRPISIGRRWLMMNVYIPCKIKRLPMHRLLSHWLYHFSMVILQKFGLAMPFIKDMRRIKYRKIT